MLKTLNARFAARPASHNPWNALWAMMVGFFMILLDATIVAVANPTIMERLGAGYDGVIWVTSAYLLAYAVPLLVSGRLGDVYGPKNLYLVGLAVFTAASLWCGLAGSIEMLIAARVVQGIGAALLTPQTLSTITRIFPPARRGVAMSVWGATAGVATLVGPLAGGILVGGLGWQWIFFVNVPIGIIGFGLAVWLIPVLPTAPHRFDVLGVALSGAGMFLIGDWHSGQFADMGMKPGTDFKTFLMPSVTPDVPQSVIVEASPIVVSKAALDANPDLGKAITAMMSEDASNILGSKVQVYNGNLKAQAPNATIEANKELVAAAKPRALVRWWEAVPSQIQGDLVAAMGAFMFNPTPEQAAESMKTMQTINADYWASK